MNKYPKKLIQRIFVIAIIAELILSVGIAFTGYYTYQRDGVQRYQEYAETILKIGDEAVSGEVLKEYIANQQTGIQYESYRKSLSMLKENSNISYIYMVYFAGPEEPQQLYYVLNGVRQEELEGKKKEEVYSYLGEKAVADAFDANMVQHFYEAMYEEEPQIRYIVNDTKDYGYQLTAYIPVLDNKGVPSCILALDLSMDIIQDNMRAYLLLVAVVTIMVFIVTSLIFRFMLEKLVIRPVGKLVESVEDFVKQTENIDDPGKLDFHKVIVNSKDEIAKLSDYLNDMTDTMKSYMLRLNSVTAEKERISTELSVATQIQASLLPCVFPPFPAREEIDIYATMHPAKEVGGDFYDFFFVDETHLAIVVADVSGKGVPAALFMVIGKTLLKDHTLLGVSLDQVFTDVNNLLCEANSEGLFITAFEGILDLVTGEFKYVNAGHEWPFIRKKNGSYKAYKLQPALVLAGMEGFEYRAGVMQLEPGDMIFQYTDGVTEATNGEEELYGMERLEQILNKNSNCTPTELLKVVKKDVDLFVGEAPQFDDITMLCLEYCKKLSQK